MILDQWENALRYLGISPELDIALHFLSSLTPGQLAVGSRVADYKVGDKVMAFGWNNNFAEYFAAKSFQLQPVPYGLDMDIASLGEPISCAMYSGLNSGVQLGDTVVVMGGGFAGQIIAQCARRKGAYLKASWPSPAGSARTSPSTPDRTTSSRPSRI